MDFLTQAFIYLAAAVISVPVANRLGMGSVLGYLIAGIVIGPALGLIGSSESEDVKHFAEFGVVMLLFLVGLELRPSALWAMRHRLIGLGGLQVVLTTALIAIPALGLGFEWRQALAIGMILSLSSTAIVLQTLNEKGLTRTPGGRAAFSVLLFQDIAVIPMLALLPLLADPSHVGSLIDHAAGGSGSAAEPGHSPRSLLSGLPGWVQALSVLVACGGIVVGGRYLMRPIFRFIAQARLREIFTAAALLLVIGIALLMDSVGLSPALGTFLAGVVLSDSEYRHELESDIDPFKGLLLGLFFISVGAGIDFGLLFGDPAVIVGLAVGVMVLKFAVLYGLASAFRMIHGDRWLFSLSLAQAGEFGFILIGFAAGASVLPDSLAGPLILAVALSMLLTPILFIVFEKVITPRMSGSSDRDADTIETRGSAVLAGVGRFGQAVYRILRANDFDVVVLDHDAGQIDQLRNFGIHSYYGDASRPDLLHAAGIEDARVFVAALDDREKQVAIVSHVRRAHPDIHIVARAIDRPHYYALREAGADDVVREVFGSSIEAGRMALVAMGFHPFTAERRVRSFRRYDERLLVETADTWIAEGGMTKAYIDSVRSSAARFEDILNADRGEARDFDESGWTPAPPASAKQVTIQPRPETEKR